MVVIVPYHVRKLFLKFNPEPTSEGIRINCDEKTLIAICEVCEKLGVGYKVPFTKTLWN